MTERRRLAAANTRRVNQRLTAPLLALTIWLLLAAFFATLILIAASIR